MKTLTLSIPVQHTRESSLKNVDFNNLEFGKYMADHMVVADYKDGNWQGAKIVPYGDITMSPAILALHYGQTVWEGMKAYRMQNGNINIFRPDKHWQRFEKSLVRMCMPVVPEEMFMQSLHALIELDQQWVPATEGSSLYIRPLVFASEAKLGVKVSDEYKFMIMCTPVAAYHSKPFKLKTEDTFVRTAEGGTGFAKCAGNYGGAFYPTQIAREQGYDQILWTDHKEHKYIDEVGMMNVMFVIDGKLVTPQLSTAILDGITRDSILKLAPEMGLAVEERRVSIDEIEEGLKSGRVTEVFGAGTAAVVAAVELINIHEHDYKVPVAGPESFQLRAKHKLANIRKGIEPDKFGWNDIITIN